MGRFGPPLWNSLIDGILQESILALENFNCGRESASRSDDPVSATHGQIHDCRTQAVLISNRASVHHNRQTGPQILKLASSDRTGVSADVSAGERERFATHLAEASHERVIWDTDPYELSEGVEISVECVGSLQNECDGSRQQIRQQILLHRHVTEPVDVLYFPDADGERLVPVPALDVVNPPHGAGVLGRTGEPVDGVGGKSHDLPVLQSR